MKKKVLMSSIVTIALCLTLIAGSTYALFTDSENVNITVTSGTVDIDSKLEGLTYGSDLNNMVLPESGVKQVEGKNEIAVAWMVPGDYFEFDLVVGNNSNVSVDYRTVLGVTNDTGLWSGLVVEIDGVVVGQLDNGVVESTYANLGAGNTTVHVRVSLPEDRGNEYQNKTCTFYYFVEAIQANHDGQ